MAFDRTTVRMLGGIALVVAIAAAFVFVYAVIRPSEADLERAAQALEQERQPPGERDPDYASPEITRWHFTTHLPVPGEVNLYRWRAQGEFACSLDADREWMVNFRLDTPNADNPIELTTPIAILDKKQRILTSETATRVTFSWGTVQSEKMRLELDTSNATFDEHVAVTAERGVAMGETATEGADAGAAGNSSEAGSDQPETATEEAPQEPLSITADHFEIQSSEDKGTFTGNVEARDSSGTICADTMIVEYFSDEEKEADPSLTGMKRVTCIGHVIIHQETEQAICERAVFDLEKNTITMEKTESAQVLYRKDDGKERYQSLADKVVIDLNPGGKTSFSGKTKSVLFSETTEDFFSLSPKEKEEPDDAGVETTNDQD